MSIARKILGVVVIALAIIMFVACVGGIVGAWTVRAIANTELRQLSEQVSELIGTVDSGVTQVETRLTSALQRTATIRERAQAFAARDLDDTAANAILAAIGGLVADELAPTIDRVGDAADSVRDRIDNLNRVIRVTNRVSGSDLPTLELGEIAVVNEAVTSARTQVGNLRTRIATRRTDTRQEIAADVTRLTLAIDSVVQPIAQRVTTLRTRIEALRGRVESLPARLDSQIFLPLALSSTFALIWLGFGEVALMFGGWLLYRGRLGRALGSEPPASNSAQPEASGEQ